VGEIVTPSIPGSGEELLGARVRMPQAVVFRSFPAETVVLNLDTGRYYGLNPSAGKMLEAMVGAASVREAAASVAAAYDQPIETIEVDVAALCGSLLDRGLVEVENGDGEA
jgi:Coenzyme PQQ synthesis protein D (PqqD)